MKVANQKTAINILDEVLARYEKDPVDLLNIGDGKGEWTYLVNSRRSYERTIRDVVTYVAGRFKHETQVRILEIGAYLGVVSTTLARLGFSVTALDIPEFMGNERLRDLYRTEGVSTLSANLRDYTIPAASNEFDVVIMCETLEHINFNPIPILLEINRVLESKGVFYLSLPNIASLVNRAKLILGRSIHNSIDDYFAQMQKNNNMIVGIHWREYTANEIRELVFRTGFRAEKHYYFTPHNPSLLARLVYGIFPSMRENQTLIAVKEKM